MGQAKQRGTLEQRVKQAQEQKDDFYGTERSVAEVLAELGLPKESTVKGYVIHLPEKDEFVAAINDNNISFSVAYARTPELAMIYDEPQKRFQTLKISKHKLLVCVLFETSNQYMINDIWANY
ncbi:hypothetical protein [Acinetobacter baumannii]|uniref:hypothetical protein n=1 Tax=Acinetobacter baumannii TaxID=470 RepID=UPI002016C349|nr:hypothetical protein [Acinetobacter baumannii]UQL68047.1 hypothetical protein M1S19_18585 [Acinetobacter baumannii]